MSTKKDQGNKYYKESKFQQAVECYKEYVKYDHSDNSKAYNNMALSYFKMKKYQNCIKACEMSIELEPQFSKAYYRMYQAYKQLQDYYNLLIVGNQFIKYSKQEKQIKQLQKELITYKQKLSFNLASQKQISEKNKLVQEIINSSQEQLQKQAKIKEQQDSRDVKWDKIETLIKKNPRIGINQAWKFLSQQFQDQEHQDYFKQLLSKTKKANKSKFNKVKEEQLSQEQLQPLIKKQQKDLTVQNQTKKQQNFIQNQQQVSNLINQTNENNQQTNQTEEKQDINLNPDEINSLIKIHVKSKMQKSKDQFECFYMCLCEIIQSKQLKNSYKKAILTSIPNKLSNFKILRNFNLKQQQNIRFISTSHKLADIIQSLYLKKK